MRKKWLKNKMAWDVTEPTEYLRKTVGKQHGAVRIGSGWPQEC